MSERREAWRPDDPVWLAQRKKEWVHVKRNLDRMTLRIKKRDQKYHKDLFFYGKTISEWDFARQGVGSPFNYGLPLFELWYHPALTDEVLEDIYNRQTSASGLNNARELLFLFPQKDFATEYGMLGGREKAAITLLLPGLDWKEERTFPNDWKGFPLALHPYHIATKCCGQTGTLLRTDKTNPFIPGQYLWDHLDYALGTYADDFDELCLRMLRLCLLRIADFDVREGAPRHFAPSVALRERLLQRFEARDFGPKLMEYWDEARAAFESGEISGDSW